ncbi:MAG: hypothetical protein ACI9XC_001465 [Gammaproteobacteria bacterium]|jgi:hypothetical protein
MLYIKLKTTIQYGKIMKGRILVDLQLNYNLFVIGLIGT